MSSSRLGRFRVGSPRVGGVYAEVLPKLFAEMSHMGKANLLGELFMGKIGLGNRVHAKCILRLVMKA